MKTDKTLREKTADILFLTGVIIEVLLVLIDKSAYTNPIEGQIFRLTFLLFLGKVCLTKYAIKEYGIIAFFGGVGVLSYLITGRNDIVRAVVFLAACKDVDMPKYLRLVFWLTLTGCLVLITLSLLGVFGTVSLTADYGRGSVETRYVLGLGHPNALQCMVCVLTMLGLYLYHKKWKWYGYGLALLVNGGFFLLTDSKTGLLVAMGAILLFFAASRIRSQKAAMFFSAGNICIASGSILLSVLCAKDAMCLWRHFMEGEYSAKIKFYVILNKLLTGRIHGLIETKNHEGVMETWSLFSNPGSNYYFDMGWVRLFYWYGVVPAILAVLTLMGMMIYFAREKKLAELAFFSMIALYTLVEAHFISVYIGRNYLLFVAGMYWWRILEKPALWERKLK